MSSNKHQLILYYKEDITSIELSNFKGSFIFLGRGLENEIQIDSPIISSKHAFFKIDGEDIELYDNKSKNGVYVNGTKIVSTKLKQRDVIRIDNLKNPLNEGVLMVYAKDEKFESNFDIILEKVGFVKNSIFFKKTQVLKDIYFKISARDFVAIAGLNSLANSSLIKILSGIIKKYVGNIYIGDVEIRKNAP